MLAAARDVVLNVERLDDIADDLDRQRAQAGRGERAARSTSSRSTPAAASSCAGVPRCRWQPSGPRMDDATRIAVVIPAYNEAGTIRDIAQRTLGRHPWLIVVDNGSTDGTVEALAGLAAHALRNSENRGKGASLCRGMRAGARAGSGGRRDAGRRRPASARGHTATHRRPRPSSQRDRDRSAAARQAQDSARPLPGESRRQFLHRLGSGAGACRQPVGVPRLSCGAAACPSRRAASAPRASCSRARS